MILSNTITITPITPDLIPQLKEFCDTCEELGYENNKSLENLNLLWCKYYGGEFFCGISNGRIISVAGCHPLPEISKNAWRIMYRGCDLPARIAPRPWKGLSKGDWNSVCQRLIFSECIQHSPSKELYLTTAHIEHSGGLALRNHRLMSLLADQGILWHHADMELMSPMGNKIPQTVWGVNIEEYYRRRKLANIQ